MCFDGSAKGQGPRRTAGEAGWRISRYNLSAPVPGTNNVAIANLFKGNCAEYTPLEMGLLSVLDELDEDHPIIERFARRGVVCNFDERAALETMGRASCAVPCDIGQTRLPQNVADSTVPASSPTDTCLPKRW